jgi:hypothetical protein
MAFINKGINSKAKHEYILTAKYSMDDSTINEKTCRLPAINKLGSKFRHTYCGRAFTHIDSRVNFACALTRLVSETTLAPGAYL